VHVGIVDLGVAAVQLHAKRAVGHRHAVAAVEHVAQHLAVGVGVVRDGALLAGAAVAHVGEGHERVAAREGVEGVIAVPLHLRRRPHRRLLPVSVHSRQEPPQRRGVAVEVGGPQGLAAAGVVAATVCACARGRGEM